MQREIWVTHRTVYEFDDAVDGATIRACLRPLDDAAQTVVESEVHCLPRPIERIAARGGERMTFRGPLRRIELTGQSRLRWDPSAGIRSVAKEPPRPDLVPAWARNGGRIWNWARQALPDDRPARDDIAAFMALMRADFVFDAAATDATTTAPAFFVARRGVCQDYARLAAGCLRARGVPVRLVFGYLIHDPAGGHRFEERQPHAWLSVWDPDAACWTDLDPTTGLTPPAHHVTLRRGRRLRDIQPVTGRVHGRPVGQRLVVNVTIVKDLTGA